MGRDRSPQGRSRRSCYDRDDESDKDAYHRGKSERARRSPSPSRRRHDHSRRETREYSPRRRDERDAPYSSRKRHRSLSPVQRSRQPPAVGSIWRSRVQTIKPFGVFVALEGFDRHGLVHHSQVSEEATLSRDDADEDKIAALEYFCPRNAQVWVKVIEVQEEASGSLRLNCSMKAVDQDSGADLDPDNRMMTNRRGGGGGGGFGGGRDGPLSEEPPEIGSVHQATVASLRPFGAFVRLQGFRSNGLVHFSQISDHLEIDREASDEEKTATIGQVLAVGDSVWVKVVEIKDADPGSDRGPKIGCSIKLVAQKDGRDLDPNSLKYRPRQAEAGGFGSRRPVGAAAGETQEGVVDWGHLNAEKVGLDPKYADYELLADDPSEARGQPGGSSPAGAAQMGHQAPGVGSVEEALAILRKHEKKKKDKKSKSKKKSSRGEDKKASKGKKKKKEKKRSKRASSTSSSGPD